MPWTQLSRAVNESFDIALIEPGKPCQNTMAQGINGKFRDECLSTKRLLRFAEENVAVQESRRHGRWRIP